MKHRTAFSLIELLVTVMLMLIVYTIVVPLTYWGVTSTKAAQDHSAMSVRFDIATKELRCDVWQARSLEVGEQKVTAHLPDGTSIAWKIGPGDQLSRGDKHWSNLGLTDTTRFEADGAALRLVVPTRPDGSRKSVTFPAQTALLTQGAK